MIGQGLFLGGSRTTGAEVREQNGVLEYPQMWEAKLTKDSAGLSNCRECIEIVARTRRVSLSANSSFPPSHRERRLGWTAF